MIRSRGQTDTEKRENLSIQAREHSSHLAGWTGLAKSDPLLLNLSQCQHSHHHYQHHSDAGAGGVHETQTSTNMANLMIVVTALGRWFYRECLWKAIRNTNFTSPDQVSFNICQKWWNTLTSSFQIIHWYYLFIEAFVFLLHIYIPPFSSMPFLWKYRSFVAVQLPTECQNCFS